MCEAGSENNKLKPHLKSQWVIPPKQNSEFVAAMEDVLEVYHRAYNANRPVVCVDEQSKQLIAETRPSIPMQSGRPECFDYEYKRCGTANLFMVFEPLGCRRRVKVTERRTMIDFAHLIRELLDEDYPEAEKIVLVSDNLNTHKAASFYEAFDPIEARRLIERIEFHHTPKHGSWLNMAEIELSILTRQCLNRRIADIDFLRREVLAWQQHRNAANSTIDWQFNTDKARIKLKKLYPAIQL